MYKFLPRVNHPHDLQQLSVSELEQLGGEIRERVKEVVDANGGHLASNLGSVELTLALHRVFDFPHKDRLVWDTSHQTYPHKLITGRRDKFHLIRTYGGICGFCNKKESIFDLFDAGHAGTACGLALGVAAADDLLGKTGKSIAVVGDSAIAAGMAFEALNHAGEIRKNLLVILNDNNMSIDRAVGALSHYFTRMRSNRMYTDFKRDLRGVLTAIPLVGKKLDEALEQVHDAVRHTVVPGRLFQDLGFNYFGPVDGHDLPGLLKILGNLKELKEPVLLHLATTKGHGYEPAAANPIKYHALKDFLGGDKKSARAAEPKPAPKPAPAPKKRPSYSAVFGEVIREVAQKDRRIAAITAGMAGGTALTAFGEEFPDRFFDVGIAEQHGAAFASGLAFAGLRPVFAVYSTFCQRAYDQFIHDICIQENSVIFCLDRAGVTGEDGWTHHGVFDIAFMRCIPNCILLAPRDGPELIRMFQFAVDQATAPVAIRYPKATVPELPPSRDPVLVPGKAEVLTEGEDVALFAYGAMVVEAYDAARRLREEGVHATVVNARFAKPVDVELLETLSRNHKLLVTLEDHALLGGFGSGVLEVLADRRIHFDRVVRLGVPDRFITFGSRQQLLTECGLDVDSVVDRISAAVADQAKMPARSLGIGDGHRFARTGEEPSRVTPGK